MSKKKLFDEDGNVVKGAKVKKPFYKRWWFIALIVFFIIGAIGSDSETADQEAVVDDVEVVEEADATEQEEAEKPEPKPTPPAKPKAKPEPAEVVEEPQEAEDEPEPEPEVVEEEPVEEVSREFRNARSKAIDYLDYTAFSKEGLYDQLLYEEFPEDAARYAVEDIEVDWNEQALKKGHDYLDYSSFSDQGLYDQLIYEEFTAEQAQYAIDNLE